MKNITTYSARRTNVFVWLAAVMMAASIAARIVFFADAVTRDVFVVVVRIILPIAANLFLILSLLIKGEKQFCVTVRPMVLLAIYFVFNIIDMKISSVAMTIAALLFCILQTVLYCLCFTGRMESKLPLLFSYLAFFALALMDGVFVRLVYLYWMGMRWMLVSDFCAAFGIVFTILSARKLPPPSECDPYRLRLGDRLDGRLLRSLDYSALIAPYAMKPGRGAEILYTNSVEVTAMERYIHQKRREGYKHFGITHVFIAAFVRCCAEFPQLNRFISGRRIFTRDQVEVSMKIINQSEEFSSESTIKVLFDKSDNAAAVYEKYDAVIQAEAPDDSGIRVRFGFGILRALDYLGMLSKGYLERSAYHGSVCIASMGSLGIPPVYHRLYDFGNIPQFFTFGAKRTIRTTNPDGTENIRKLVDYKWTLDERLIDNVSLAAMVKRFQTLVSHPEMLDEIPEVIPDIE